MTRFFFLIFFILSIPLFPNIHGVKDSIDVSKKNNIDSLKTSSSDSLAFLKKGTLTNSNILLYSLNKNEINKRDYRFTGNLISYMPFGFLNDLGTNGQPHPISLYGNSVSLMSDGVLLNNRLNNTFDLINFQSERIDSIELLPITKGFLYGNYNNSAAVNFIIRDTAITAPTTRLRYYQAPEDEEFVNLSFDTKIFNPLYLTVDITNHSVEPRYENTQAGGWKVNTRLKYLLSESTNIFLNYNSVSTETQLFGGINASSKDLVEYDNTLAEVVYPFTNSFSSRFMKTKQDFLTLSILSKLLSDNPTNIDFYYIFNKTEFRQNERTNLDYIDNIIHDNSFKTLGISASQKIDLNKFAITINSNFEQNNFTADLLGENISQNFFSVAGIAETEILDKLHSSIFTKYLNTDGNSYGGFGGNLNFSISNEVKFFVGYSIYEKPIPISFNLEPGILYFTPKEKVFESSIKYSSKNISTMLSFFSKENEGDLLPLITNLSDTTIVNEVGYFRTISSTQKGLNLNFDVQLWKILLQGNANYMPEFEEKTSIYPEYNFIGGIYYLDTLFNNNLKLKAGFNFQSIGQQQYFVIDFERNVPVKYFLQDSQVALLKNEYTDLVNTVDLFISATFQDAAVVNFVFENIFDQEYFIAPYYPKQGQGIRFGITWEILN